MEKLKDLFGGGWTREDSDGKIKIKENIEGSRALRNPEIKYLNWTREMLERFGWTEHFKLMLDVDGLFEKAISGEKLSGNDLNKLFNKNINFGALAISIEEIELNSESGIAGSEKYSLNNFDSIAKYAKKLDDMAYVAYCIQTLRGIMCGASEDLKYLERGETTVSEWPKEALENLIVYCGRREKYMYLHHNMMGHWSSLHEFGRVTTDFVSGDSQRAHEALLRIKSLPGSEAIIAKVNKRKGYKTGANVIEGPSKEYMEASLGMVFDVRPKLPEYLEERIA